MPRSSRPAPTRPLPTSETVYTFSFTTDWFHTVNAVAPMSDAIVPFEVSGKRSHEALADSVRLIKADAVETTRQLNAAGKRATGLAIKPVPAAR